MILTHDTHHALAVAAALLTVAANIPYIAGILRGAITPHVFSWIIWATVATIAAIAQSSAGAGVGAWPTYCGAAMALVVAALAFANHAQIAIARIDVLIFIGALGAIPLWQATKTPLAASITVTSIGLAAFAITLRKVWRQPHSENRTSYALNAIRFALATAALEQFTPATLVFPIASLFAHLVTVAIITHRLRRLKACQPAPLGPSHE